MRNPVDGTRTFIGQEIYWTFTVALHRRPDESAWAVNVLGVRRREGRSTKASCHYRRSTMLR